MNFNLTEQQRNQLEALAEEYAERKRSDESVSIAEYVEKHPIWLTTYASCFQSWQCWTRREANSQNKINNFLPGESDPERDWASVGTTHSRRYALQGLDSKPWPGRKTKAAPGSGSHQVGSSNRSRTDLDPLTIAELCRIVGISYRSLGDSKKAIPLLQRSLDILIDELGPNDRQVISAMNGLGVAYLREGQFDKETESLLREAWEIRELKTPDSWLKFQLQSRLGEALLRQGEFESSLTELTLGLEGMRRGQPATGVSATMYQSVLYRVLDSLIELAELTSNADAIAKWKAEKQALEFGN